MVIGSLTNNGGNHGATAEELDPQRGAHRSLTCISLFPACFLEVRTFYQDKVNATFREPQVRQVVRRVIVSIPFSSAYGAFEVEVYSAASAFLAPVMGHSGNHRDGFGCREVIPAIRI